MNIFYNAIAAEKRWLRFDRLAERPSELRAYRYNIAQKPDFSSNFLPDGTLVDQNGGVFPSLKFRRAKMSGVCCGVIAVYNALALTDRSADFLKLAAEFEYNAAVPAIPQGAFGSNPMKIGYCLDAYGIKSRKFHRVREFDSALSDGKIGIVCFVFGAIDPRAHFFAVKRTADGIDAYNFYSNACLPTQFSSVGAALEKDRRVFLVGYILENEI